MEKKCYFTILGEEEYDTLCSYLAQQGFLVEYPLRINDTRDNSRECKSKYPVFSGVGFALKIRVEDGSRLEKVLDEFMGRDSNPSDLPRPSDSGA